MKIYVTGPAWSWKSTIANRLAIHFNLPVTHLDELLWNEDWMENPSYGELQRKAISNANWIIEWPSCSIVKSMPEVDLVVILDTSPMWNVWRMISRRLKSLIGVEKRIWISLPDSISLDFIKRTLIWRKRQLPRLMRSIGESWLGEKVLIVRNPSDWFDCVVTRALHISRV